MQMLAAQCMEWCCRDVWPLCLAQNASKCQQLQGACTANSPTLLCVPCRLALEDRLAALVRHLDSSWLGPWRWVVHRRKLACCDATILYPTCNRGSAIPADGTCLAKSNIPAPHNSSHLHAAFTLQVSAAGRASGRRCSSWQCDGRPLAAAFGGRRAAGLPAAGWHSAPCCGGPGAACQQSSQQLRGGHVPQ